MAVTARPLAISARVAGADTCLHFESGQNPASDVQVARRKRGARDRDFDTCQRRKGEKRQSEIDEAAGRGGGDEPGKTRRLGRPLQSPDLRRSRPLLPEKDRQQKERVG